MTSKSPPTPVQEAPADAVRAGVEGANHSTTQPGIGTPPTSVATAPPGEADAHPPGRRPPGGPKRSRSAGPGKPRAERATICLPCQEQECDTCHNLLWEAGCSCRHAVWPEPRCGVQGREKDGRRSGRRWVCDLSALEPHRIHQGRYWYDPDPDPHSAYWWGWRKRPERWGPKRVVAPVGRFDPYDPTVPSETDREVA